MIFYFNSNGESLGLTSERVFQGSNLASRIYFVCPVAKQSVVSVAFTLPDGTNSGPHLMLSAVGEISGVVNNDGESFNNWYFDIPESVTSIAGNVGVQFAVTSGESVMTTASCVFTVESGIYPRFSEQVMSYREIMAFLENFAAQSGNGSNSDDIESEISSLSDDLEDLETAMSSANTSISSIRTTLNTATGNISGLQTRMTTAEGKITALETSVSGKASTSYVDNAISAAIGTAISTPV